MNNTVSQDGIFTIQNQFFDAVPELWDQNEACRDPNDHTAPEVHEQEGACPDPNDHSRHHLKFSQSSAASSHRWCFEQSDSDTLSDLTPFKPNEYMSYLNDYPVVLPDYQSPFSASQISTIGIGSEVHCNIGIGVNDFNNQDPKPHYGRKSHRRSKRKQSRRWKRIGPMDLYHANQSGDSGIGLSSSLSGDTLPRREVMSQSVASPAGCYHPVRRTSSLLGYDLYSTNTYPRRRRQRSGAFDITDFSDPSTPVVPPCIRPTATLHRCTSMGRTYRDRLNGFKLKIPHGAIPEGESLTVDIGVALYGPFQ